MPRLTKVIALVGTSALVSIDTLKVELYYEDGSVRTFLGKANLEVDTSELVDAGLAEQTDPDNPNIGTTPTLKFTLVRPKYDYSPDKIR